MASHHILSGCVLLVLMLTLTQAKDFHVPVISDVHLELNYDPRVTSYDYCLRGGRPATEPAFYGRRGCDTPHTLFYSALQRMKNVESHPDLIIVPGDMVTHFLCFEDNREFNETIYQEILSVMNNYTQTTAAVFPGVPVVFTEGNADYMYDYQVPTPKYKTRHYQALYDSWIKNIPANSAAVPSLSDLV